MTRFSESSAVAGERQRFARFSAAFGVFALGLLLAASALAQTTPLRAGYNRDVIYQVFVDRFHDGSTTNNFAGPLFDGGASPNLQKYTGGDFQGLAAKVPYLKNMGITAIWVTSPLDNRDTLAAAGSIAPYHGYEMRDTLKTERYFTDASGSWAPFDSFVTAAHNAGIKVIVDFAPNHSNVRNSGDNGTLNANGVFQFNYSSPGGYFQTGPNMGGAQWDSRYETQYYTIYDLADLNQENPLVDSLLKEAVINLQAHGVDGFRIDATKHVNWGWQYTLANFTQTNAKSFIFGEWVADDANNPLYGDMVKFSNKSGIAELNFPLFTTINSVFGQGGSMVNLNAVIAQQQLDFAYQNDLVNFVDNHDRKRFLTVDTSSDDRKHLHQALAFVLTARGVPCVYYGTEQYLEGGDDPDNRRKMPAFNETTAAFQLIKSLSTLRQNNEALAFGAISQRWINSNVYIYERTFFNNVVVVAINKGTTAQSISGLVTSLPTGTYNDYLAGAHSGLSLTSGSAVSGGFSATVSPLPANSISVWQYDPSVSSAQLGNVTPTRGQPGVSVVIAGQGFGSSTGTVRFGSTLASIISWKDQEVVASVPSVANGTHAVTLRRAGSGTDSNSFNFTVYKNKLIPVTFTVNNAAPTAPGDEIYLVGDTVELGNWSATRANAIGPMNTTPTTYPNWWLTVGVPASTTLKFKAIRIKADGSVTWEAGADHSYSTPASGVASVSFNWQY